VSAPSPYPPPFPHSSGARPPAIAPERMPRHVAVVMDGNGRWANARGLPRTAGQRYWACLSPENWQQIAQELGIAALLVPADWAVRLPPLVRDGNYALYAMPREMSPQRPAGAADSSCALDRE